MCRLTALWKRILIVRSILCSVFIYLNIYPSLLIMTFSIMTIMVDITCIVVNIKAKKKKQTGYIRLI